MSDTPTAPAHEPARREGVQRGTTAEDLKARMAGVRSALESDVADVSDATNDLTDWKYYVKQHPIALVGIAAAVGYLVVPSRTEVIKPSPEALRKMAAKKKVYISNKPQKASRDRSMLDRGLSIAGAFAARAATAYAAQQFGKFTGHAASDASPPSDA